METNLFVGMLVTSLSSLLGLYVLIYNTFLKPQLEQEKRYLEDQNKKQTEQSKRQAEQIRAQVETNAELRSLNEKLDDILKEHERQGDRIYALEDKCNDHEVRIRTIEKTNFKKYRVD